MKTNTLAKSPDYRKVTLTYKNQKFIILTIIPKKIQSLKYKPLNKN